ncbi:DNA polymerase III subunit alpha [Candidatus Falkowbacteria bacterium]|nr:DNA polymerase III subunit alpha [Candidatus Falkowbacteria bacterium]NCT55159.1 DNA polymerase III subunit alpha [Candidatus Falkowbacteria bacterium]
MSFVHLHNHSHYSLLDGLTKFDEMIGYALEQGSPAVALTDHGTMYGVIEFYQKAKKAGLKPIIGVEAYLAPSSRHEKNTREDARSRHLVLLAKNKTGYQNLIKLVSIAHLEGFYYKPRIDWELLEAHHEGVIALSACLAGEIPRLLSADKFEEARDKALEYDKLFGRGNFYLEIQDHPELEGQAKVNKFLIKLSKETGIPLVATNDTHYFKKEDDIAQDILLCLQNKKKITDTDRMKMIGHGDYSMRSNAEMIAAFKDVPEAIANTLKIAEACDLEIELGNIQLPHFEVPDGFNGDSYLRKLCEDGLEKRYGLIKDGNSFISKNNEISLTHGINLKKILERLDYELSVVAKMGWPSYFLIVADFVNWAKERKIVVGPGRGSAAGSLVCYLTGITNLDPLQYDLLFERFLNPDRISMPDIDLDFADARRAEVIDYVSEKYGYDHVAQIITFGTMAARAAVRDVGRVLDAPYDYCDKISKSIPMFTKLDEALRTVPEVKALYQEPEAKKIIDYARRLEGVARHSSTHACGVLITKEPLTNYVPIQHASSSDKTIISQYSLHPVEDLGLLKMDFLGLKNLTIIESTLKIIKNTRNKEIDIDLIPLNDNEAYELFRKGETTGVFQFESSGMKRYLRELKPTEFEDIIAMVALYRPGPMEWIPDYISGKNGKKKVVYLHEKLQPILAKTYGVAIYQEQVMQIARALAGFSPGEADVLRKAMGKKIPALLAEQKEKFIDGCVKNGIYKELAEKVFSFIEPFAGYGFNRSHAACYAMIGYQTAYLKAHYPAEFMAALLTSDQGDTDRVAIEIEECRNMNIKITPPDINESFGTFTVVSSGTKDNKPIADNEKINTIRFGLRAVKNVGEHIVEEIIKERKANGPYRDIFDLLERVTNRDLNKKSMESLIKCGAFDSLGDRATFLLSLEKLLNYNKEVARDKDSNQASLFADSLTIDLPKITLSQASPIDQNEILSWEKELLGLYVSEHPYNIFRPYLEGYAVSVTRLKGRRGDNSIVSAGVISTIKKILTKKGEIMLFVKVEDSLMSVEFLVFPRTYKETESVWIPGQAVIVSGTISEKDLEVKFLVDKAMALDYASPGESVDAFKKMMFNSPPAKKRFSSYGNNGSTVNGSDGSWGAKKVVNNSKSLVPNGGNFRAVVTKINQDKQASNPESKENVQEIKKDDAEFNNVADVNDILQIIIKKDLSSADSENLKNIFLAFPGETLVYLMLVVEGKYRVVKTSFRVKNSEELIVKLEEFLVDKFEVLD